MCDAYYPKQILLLFDSISLESKSMQGQRLSFVNN